MCEVENTESVSVVIENGKYGVIIARIETKPATNGANFSIIARTGVSKNALKAALTQEDTYQYSAETTNKVYELPLYYFSMSNGAITLGAKEITAIKEITTIKQTADSAITTANGAVATANTANSTANTAKSTANSAKSTAETAQSTANANTKAITAINTRLGNLGFSLGNATNLSGVSSVTLKKLGKFVVCKFTYTKSSFSFTLPSGFAPYSTFTVEGLGTAYNSSQRVYQNTKITINVTSGGSITCSTNLGGDVNCTVQIGWSIDSSYPI